MNLLSMEIIYKCEWTMSNMKYVLIQFARFISKLNLTLIQSNYILIVQAIGMSGYK